MMGRLNYTNRKIEDLKLGQVVAKDLIKRIPPSIGSKAALRDPVVELDVSGRGLTSEGFFDIATALVKSIDYEGEHGKVVRLEELCLRENKLDARCLQALGKVIRLAAGDLRDLDMSDNLISVMTYEEVAAWEDFLTSFSECCVLRRIDFSGNSLGPRAFEVLARIYAREPPLDLISLEEAGTDWHDDASVLTNTAYDSIALEQRTRALSIVSESEDYTSDGESIACATPGVPKSSRHDPKSPEKAGHLTTQAELQPFYASTRGLRSVPYLIFSNTAMMDACALHLSYLVVYHNIPQQLLERVPPAKAGPPSQQLFAYDEELRCHGIVYFPNSNMGNAGLRVLELAENLRISLLNEIAHDGVTTPSQDSFEVNNAARRASEAQASSATGLVLDRRRSTTSMTKGQRMGHDTARIARIELERARHRVQGDTLRDAGQQSTELWQTSLRMLALSRTICLMPRQVRPQNPINYLESIRPSTSPERPSTRNKYSDDNFNFPALPNPMSKPLKPLTIPAPLAAANPNQPLTRRFHQHQKDTFTFLTPIATPTFQPAPCPPPATQPELTRQNTYRSSLPLGFSFGVWRRIIAMTASANGIMSEAQQRSVLRWGMDRGTLNRERESLGLAENVQIWKVLEGTDCLAYEANA